MPVSSLRHQRSGIPKPDPQDLAKIRAIVESKGLRVVSIAHNVNPWYYWIRGKLLVSNVARIYVALAESQEGKRRTIHIAFDDGLFGRTKDPQILIEKDTA